DNGAHARRKCRVVLGDHRKRVGAVETLHDRLDQGAGRTVTLGDDDKPVIGQKRIRHERHSLLATSVMLSGAKHLMPLPESPCFDGMRSFASLRTTESPPPACR